jgi:hypothetical protein
MSNSTADKERKKEREREILVCDLHPQHIRTHPHTYYACVVIELIEGRRKEIDRLMRDTITKKKREGI